MPARRVSTTKQAKAEGKRTMSRRLLLSVLQTLAAFAYAFGALAWATGGFHGLTRETIRAYRVASHPIPIPPVVLMDQTGHRFTLNRSPMADRAVLVVDFVYTGCLTVCSAMGSRFQQLQQEIAQHGWIGKVRLVSISFDPVHDTVSTIAHYAERMHADARTWQIARVADPAQLPVILQTFGIRVIAGPLGQFEHNAAFHIVDAKGNLVKIMTFDTRNDVLLDSATLRVLDLPLTGDEP